MNSFICFMRLSILFFAAILFVNTAVAQTNTWTGAASTDWHVGCNWSLGIVPTCAHSVVIPNGVTNKPIITGVASCLTIDIQGVAVTHLTINTGALLQVNTCPVANTVNASGKIVFITSLAMPAVTTVANRDARCNTEAAAAGLTGTYKAWIYNAGANNVTSAGGSCGYKKVDGTKVADDWTDLTNGSLDSPINMQANGTGGIGDEVYTGLTSTGAASSRNCSNWTSQTANGTYGYSWVTTGSWTNAGFDECRNTSQTYTFVGRLANSWGDTQCNTCFPGTQAMSSGSCGGNYPDPTQPGCAVSWVAFCCCTACGTPNPPTYSVLSRKHYCFEQ